MKRKTLIVISLAVCFAVSAVILAGCKSKLFGQVISDKTITPIRSIVMKPADYNDKTVTVEGKITVECSTGCWFDLQQDAAVLHIDIEPSGLAIPQKVGKIVTVQGTIKIKENNKPMLIGSGVEIK
jgi:starvation-inducible outer membrane lipoprotein